MLIQLYKIESTVTSSNVVMSQEKVPYQKIFSLVLHNTEMSRRFSYWRNKIIADSLSVDPVADYFTQLEHNTSQMSQTEVTNANDPSEISVQRREKSPTNSGIQSKVMRKWTKR